MSDNVGEHLKRGNLLWEGSRMFLPEHREQLLERRRNRREFRMPELDEDWLNEISRTLSESLEYQHPITIVYGTKYETQQVTGVVRRINPYDGWVQLACAVDEDSTDDDQVLQIAWRRIVEIRGI